MAHSEANRTAEVLEEADVDAAILSSGPTVARATGYVPSWEMWPGYNPYVPEPALALAWADRDPVLFLPNYYGPYAMSANVEVELFTTYAYTEPLDAVDAVVAAVARRLGVTVGRLGYEPRTLPAAIKARIDERIRVGEWVDISDPLERARVIKSNAEIAALRQACAVADLIQSTVREHAEPGRREIDVANACVSAAWEHEEHRFAILLQLTTGAATANFGGWEPGGRRIAEGDLICTDTAPWLRGFWGDSCSAVVVGEPTARQRELFDLVRRSLTAGLAAARPGVEAREVDEACRVVMRDAGHDYAHHTGHGIGGAHTEAPRITPDSTEKLAENMVLCLEPGVYIEGWGGFRLEHQFVVRADGPEMLTKLEHTL
jgi:Xaa-Pro dipeptidase